MSTICTKYTNNNNCNNNKNNKNKNKLFNDDFIYIFCGNDHNDINSLYRFNVNNKTIEKLKYNNQLIQDFGTFRGSLFSISSTNENIFISNGKSYLKYNISKEKIKLIKNDPRMDNAMYRSSYYDGLDHIYIIGGLMNGELQQSIYRWNIKNGEYLLVAKTLGPVLEAQLCYSSRENSIYMLGGWISDKDYNQTIDKFNLNDYSVETVYLFENKQTLFSHSCYVPKNNSLYIYKWKINQFYRFDINSKTIHPLASCIRNPNFSRLLFDGNDLIFYCNSTKIYEYSCSNDTWVEHSINEIDHKYVYTTHRI